MASFARRMGLSVMAWGSPAAGCLRQCEASGKPPIITVPN